MFYGADNMQTGWYFGFNNPYYGTALSMGYQNTFLDLVPEVGHLLADHGLGADAAGYLRHYAVIQPVWYKAHAENLQYCTGEAAGIMANDAYQLFMAHAWIAGTPPATLGALHRSCPGPRSGTSSTCTSSARRSRPTAA